MKQLLFSLLFLLFNLIGAYYLYNSYTSDVAMYSDAQTSQLSQLYEGALTTYRLNTRSVFNNIIMQPEILKLLRRLPDTDHDGSKFIWLHNALYSLLKVPYQTMKENLDIRQLHFHTTDGRSLLRMHRPDQYGDLLFNIRYSLKQANTEKSYVEGFEEGRTFNGYRYVYPIIEDQHHLGNVEISISMTAIFKQLNHIFKNSTFYFMLDKKVVNDKVLASERNNYLPSKLHDNFYVDNEVLSLFNSDYEPYLERLSQDNTLSEKLLRNTPFIKSERNVTMTFLPIKNVEQKFVAYLVTFKHNNLFTLRWTQLIYQLISLFMILLIIFLLIDYLIRQTNHVKTEKNRLNTLVSEKVKKLKISQEKQIRTYHDIVLALINLTEKRDSYTAGHTRRVADYAIIIAQAMNHDKENLKILFDAAILHDIGKIVTPDSVLLKPGKLSNREYEIIKEHVIVSESILTTINFHPDVIEIVKYHHERFDGTGYPYNIANNEIPKLSRILAVADSFDAMTTNRIYKPRKSIKVALQELKSLAGKQYDPEVVAIAVDVLQDVHIEHSIFQLPTNVIEQERLAYYFKDSLTGLYNIHYLDLLLQFGLNGKFHQCANIVSIKNFNPYNKEHGWKTGNEALIKLVGYLKQLSNKALFFHIYGGDFVILSEEYLEINFEKFSTVFLKNCHSDLQLNLLHYDLKDLSERKSLISKLESLVN